MRLLTINIHSHGSDFEPELYHQKMKALAAFMKEEEIDTAAIQECSEEEDRPVVSGPLPMHWVPPCYRRGQFLYFRRPGLLQLEDPEGAGGLHR